MISLQLPSPASPGPPLPRPALLRAPRHVRTSRGAEAATTLAIVPSRKLQLPIRRDVVHTPGPGASQPLAAASRERSAPGTTLAQGPQGRCAAAQGTLLGTLASSSWRSRPGSLGKCSRPPGAPANPAACPVAETGDRATRKLGLGGSKADTAVQAAPRSHSPPQSQPPEHPLGPQQRSFSHLGRCRPLLTAWSRPSGKDMNATFTHKMGRLPMPPGRRPPASRRKPPTAPAAFLSGSCCGGRQRLRTP